MATITTRTVASYPSYEQAQHAVDALADRRFPVERLAIVGAGLQSYEQITGRMGYGKAALEGLVSGALVGAVLGWLLGLLSLVRPLVSAVVLSLWGVLIGAIVGAIVGLIAHALTGGRRDFSSVTQVRAQHYDLVAEPEFAGQAEEELARLGALPEASSGSGG